MLVILQKSTCVLGVKLVRLPNQIYSNGTAIL